MIDFFLSTGLRVGELVGLQVGHVCGNKPQGSGRMVRHTLALPGELAKGGRERAIPLNAQARQAVAEILSFNHRRGFSVTPEAPLFPNRKHQAMSTRAVRRVLSAHSVQADLDQAVAPHDLRYVRDSAG
jgi:integrase/recombinase XerD